MRDFTMRLRNVRRAVTRMRFRADGEFAMGQTSLLFEITFSILPYLARKEYRQLPREADFSWGGAGMALHDVQEQWRQKYRLHTDLALEAREVIVEREGPPEIPGVAVETEETEYGTISRVVIMNEVGARAMGKMPGRYSTIEAPALRERDREALERI